MIKKNRKKIIGVAVCALDKPYKSEGCENNIGLQFDLAYALNKNYRGEKLSHDFLKSTCDYLLLLISKGKKNREIRIEMKVDVENIVSNKVAKKLSNMEDPHKYTEKESEFVNFYYWQKRS